MLPVIAIFKRQHKIITMPMVHDYYRSIKRISKHPNLLNKHYSTIWKIFFKPYNRHVRISLKTFQNYFIYVQRLSFRQFRS